MVPRPRSRGAVETAEVNGLIGGAIPARRLEMITDHWVQQRTDEIRGK